MQVLVAQLSYFEAEQTLFPNVSLNIYCAIFLQHEPVNIPAKDFFNSMYPFQQ
jgi:hypothetical protein